MRALGKLAHVLRSIVAPCRRGRPASLRGAGRGPSREASPDPNQWSGRLLWSPHPSHCCSVTGGGKARLGTLRGAQLDQARRVYGSRLETGRGGIVFIAGYPASGRSALLRELEEDLAGLKPQPLMLSGRMVEGSYVASPRAPSETRERIAKVEEAARLAGAAWPLLGLAMQLVSATRFASNVTATRRSPDRPPSLNDLFRSLRSAARRQPVICLVDDCDEADGRWWSELLLTLATEIDSGLSVFLFLALEGDTLPGGHRDDEPDALFAARHLVERGLAEWWSLELRGAK